MLIGAGEVEVVQRIAVVVVGDVARLVGLCGAVAAGAGGQKDGDLTDLLDDLADDECVLWWAGKGTSARTVAAWAAAALAPLLLGTSTPEAASDHALLLHPVRGAAGGERIELTAERERAYSRRMLALIRTISTSLAPTAHATGLP